MRVITHCDVINLLTNSRTFKMAGQPGIMYLILLLLLVEVYLVITDANFLLRRFVLFYCIRNNLPKLYHISNALTFHSHWPKVLHSLHVSHERNVKSIHMSTCLHKNTFCQHIKSMEIKPRPFEQILCNSVAILPCYVECN